MKNELFKGLEQACTEFNNWQGNAVIFIDCEDMDAWCEVFDVRNYHADEIIKLVSKDDLYDRNDKYSLRTLQEVAEAKYNDYKSGGLELWQINDDYLYSKILY